MVEGNKVLYLERTQQTLVHAHHRAGIVKLSAVIGCTEQRNQLPLREELVAIFDDLMRTTDQVHVMFLQESRYHVRTESERNSTIVLTPSSDVFVWVRPEKIAKKATVRDLGMLAWQSSLPIGHARERDRWARVRVWR